MKKEAGVGVNKKSLIVGSYVGWPVFVIGVVLAIVLAMFLSQFVKSARAGQVENLLANVKLKPMVDADDLVFVETLERARLKGVLQKLDSDQKLKFILNLPESAQAAFSGEGFLANESSKVLEYDFSQFFVKSTNKIIKQFFVFNTDSGLIEVEERDGGLFSENLFSTELVLRINLLFILVIVFYDFNQHQKSFLKEKVKFCLALVAYKILTVLIFAWLPMDQLGSIFFTWMFILIVPYLGYQLVKRFTTLQGAGFVVASFLLAVTGFVEVMHSVYNPYHPLINFSFLINFCLTFPVAAVMSWFIPYGKRRKTNKPVSS